MGQDHSFGQFSRVDHLRPFCKASKVAGGRVCGANADQLESWQSLPSATPPNRYFAFTHALDKGWTADHYCRSWQMLRLAKFESLGERREAKFPFRELEAFDH